MESGGGNPFAVDNIFGLLSVLGVSFFSLMSFLLKAKLNKKAVSLEEEAVGSYKTMFQGLMDRCAKLEGKVEYNEIQIAKWEQKYNLLQSKAENDRFNMTRIINTQAEKILQQTTQINTLTAEVKTLKQRLLTFTASDNQIRL